MATFTDAPDILAGRDGGCLLAPRVPQGLAAAVEGLTREVLRHRPEDIYVFAASHFEKLLRLREQYDLRENPPLRRGFRYRSRRRILAEGSTAKALLRNTADKSGWSLNETAKVLDRYRSIFGEDGKKISTEDVRALANRKLTSSATDGGDSRSKVREYRGSSSVGKVRRNESVAAENDEDGTSKKSSIPKIIPKWRNPNGPMKNMKSELRRNRLSEGKGKSGTIKDRRKDRQRLSEVERGAILSKSSGESFPETSAKSSQDPAETPASDEDPARTGKVHTRSSQRHSRSNVLDATAAGTPGMDRVKEYVVRSFSSAETLDELQSTKYVERVQEVMDRTAPIVKGKVDELKCIARASRSSGETDVGQTAETSMEGAEYIEDMSSANLTKSNGKTKSVSACRRSKRSENGTGFDGEARSSDELDGSKAKRRRSSSGRDLDSGSSTSDSSGKLSFPAVRPPSSRGSRSVSRNDSDNFVLPPISPDASSVSRRKDDVTLPLLVRADRNVPAGDAQLEGADERGEDGDSGKRNEAEESDAITETKTEDEVSDRLDGTKVEGGFSDEASRRVEGTTEKAEASGDFEGSNEYRDSGSSKTTKRVENVSNVPSDVHEKNDLEVGAKKDAEEAGAEEIFKDSLNVTPEVSDLPPRPDSLEPEGDRDSENDDRTDEETGTDMLTEKLLAIETAERNVARALDMQKIHETATNDAMEAKAGGTDTCIKAKLEELEQTEKRIDQILESDALKKLKLESETDKRMADESSDVENVASDTDKVDVAEGEDNRRQVESHADEGETKEERKKSSDATLNKKKEQLDQELSDDGVTKGPDVGDGSTLSPVKEVCLSYVLTEGSPCEIPEFVTTVIIPDRSTRSPESEFSETRSKVEDGKDDVLKSSGDEGQGERAKKIAEAFGEYIKPEANECSTVDVDFIRGIKASHDLMITRQDLTEIKEEEEEPRSEEEDAPRAQSGEPREEGRVDGGSIALDDISENDEKEAPDSRAISPVAEVKASGECTPNSPDERVSDSTPSELKGTNGEFDNVVENSLDAEESTEARTSESTNEVKETTITDRSSESLSLNAARPVVPELNLDSLKDIELSSSKIIDNEDGDETAEKNGSFSMESSGEKRMESNGNHKVEERELVVTGSAARLTTGEVFREQNTDSCSSVETGQSRYSDDKVGQRSPNVSSDARLEDDAAIIEEEIARELIEIDRMRSPDSSQNDASGSVQSEGLVVPDDQVENEQPLSDSVAKGVPIVKNGDGEQKGQGNEDTTPVATSVEKLSNEDDNQSHGRNSSEELLANDAIIEKEEGAEPDAKESIDTVTLTTDRSQIEDYDKGNGTEDSEDLLIKDILLGNNEEVDSAEEGHLDKVTVVTDKSTNENDDNDIKDKAHSEESLIQDTFSLGKACNTDADVNGVLNTEIQSIDTGKSEVNLMSDGKEEPSVSSAKGTSIEKKDTNEDESKESFDTAMVLLDEGRNGGDDEIKSKEDSEDLLIKEILLQPTEHIECEAEDNVDTVMMSGDENRSECDDKSMSEEKFADMLANDMSVAKIDDIDSSTQDTLETTEVNVSTKRDNDVEENQSNGKVDPEASMTKDTSTERPDKFESKTYEISEPATADISTEKNASDSHGEGADAKRENYSDANSVNDDVEDQIAEYVVLEESNAEQGKKCITDRIANKSTIDAEDLSNESRQQESPDKQEKEDSGKVSDIESDDVSKSVEEQERGDEENDEYDEKGSADGKTGTTSNNETGSIDNSAAGHQINNCLPVVEESITENTSSIETAVTKIQAGVRGLLTRRRLQSAQFGNSTLDSTPSIQDTIAIEPPNASALEVALTRDEEGRPAETVQLRNNKARQRLRREDAVQKKTLSLENAFTGGGLQHTGEFHDCLPLPVLETTPKAKWTSPNKDDSCRGSSSDGSTEQNSDLGGTIEQRNSELTSAAGENGPDGSPEQQGSSTILRSLHNIPKSEQRQIVELLLFPWQFGKEDSALENNYLNFITSVEDVEAQKPEYSADLRHRSVNEQSADEEGAPSSGSIREPLALPGTPKGVEIEELDSSDEPNLASVDQKPSVSESVEESGTSMDITESTDNSTKESSTSEHFEEVPIDNSESDTTQSTNLGGEKRDESDRNQQQNEKSEASVGSTDKSAERDDRSRRFEETNANNLETCATEGNIHQAKEKGNEENSDPELKGKSATGTESIEQCEKLSQSESIPRVSPSDITAVDTSDEVNESNEKDVSVSNTTRENESSPSAENMSARHTKRDVDDENAEKPPDSASTKDTSREGSITKKSSSASEDDVVFLETQLTLKGGTVNEERRHRADGSRNDEDVEASEERVQVEDSSNVPSEFDRRGPIEFRLDAKPEEQESSLPHDSSATLSTFGSVTDVPILGIETGEPTGQQFLAKEPCGPTTSQESHLNTGERQSNNSDDDTARNEEESKSLSAGGREDKR